MPSNDPRIIALGAALAANPRDQRAAIKGLVTPLIEAITNADLIRIRDAFHAKGYTGARAQHSYIRDSTSVTVQVLLYSGDMGLSEFIENLIEFGPDYIKWRHWIVPGTHSSSPWEVDLRLSGGGMCSFTNATLAGSWLIGEAKAAYDAHGKKTPATAATITPAVSNEMLQSAVNVIDAFAIKHNVSHDVAIEVYECAMDAPKPLIDGIKAAIAARTSAPTDLDEVGAWLSSEYDAMDNEYTDASSTYNTRKDTSTVTNTAAAAPKTIEPNLLNALNSLLTSASLPPVDQITEALRAGAAARREADDLRLKLASAPVSQPVSVAATGTIPAGKTVNKKARDVFANAGLTSDELARLDFEVPVFEWDAAHPHVPNVDPAYIFRIDALITTLYCLIRNKRLWIHGMTGSGKTTLIEQVASYLQWPFMRVNFDSEITRMDLVGNHKLDKDSSGAVVSKFVDGVLPQAMQGPYILCLDEISYVKPDNAYTLQRPLEPNGKLLIAEDGGRIIAPHEMFRIVATDNTVGQGDEKGLYAGARPQSMAFINRFDEFIEVPYLSKEQESALLLAKLPGLTKSDAETIARYAHEHREAFSRGELLIPVSPRNTLGIGEKLMFLSATGLKKGGLTKAIESIVLARCSQSDAAVVRGLIDRISK